MKMTVHPFDREFMDQFFSPSNTAPLAGNVLRERELRITLM